jgi:DNA polymerase III epsilon subunit-like protein
MSYSVFFDLETGGLADFHPNIQLAAIAVDDRDMSELATFERKIQFSVESADPQALRMNHYDAEAWKREAVPASDACEGLSKFMQPYRCIEFISKNSGRPYSVAKLIGHNAATFDGPRLQRMFKEHGMFLGADPRVRCTCQAAMLYADAIGAQPPSYKLAELCKWLGLPVDENAHDALVDVRMTIALAKKLRSSVRSVSEVAA